MFESGILARASPGIGRPVSASTKKQDSRRALTVRMSRSVVSATSDVILADAAALTFPAIDSTNVLAIELQPRARSAAAILVDENDPAGFKNISEASQSVVIGSAKTRFELFDRLHVCPTLFCKSFDRPFD